MADNLILVVDDEQNIREIVRAYLEREGFEVAESADGEDAVKRARDLKPVLIVLDLMLPRLDGWEVCRQVRQFSAVPIVMLTARGETIDRVAGLEMGADDYISKPFSPREMIARVKAVLRRTRPAGQPAETVSCGAISISKDSHRATCAGTEINLTPKEFDVLWFMMQARGRVCARELLLERVWGYDYFGDARTVDSHIKSLREKLGPEGSKHIRTVWGVGYRFEDPENVL
ncbi:MAG: response regulator transcription factor [Bacillota bacterium]|nr:response regulator transcription factor [Bacillota bacterium]